MLNLILRLQLCCLILEGVYPMSIRNDTNPNNSIETLTNVVQRLEERLNNITHIIEKDKASERKAVFFFVRRSDYVTLNKYSIVTFSEAVINEGKHFNIYDGIFVAPVSGIYQFTWTTRTESSKTAGTELRVNNIQQAFSYMNIGSSAGYASATMITLCQVQEGHHVWIQTTSSFSENYFYVNSFTGMLIHY